jgi:Ca2+-binding RTX toxin-like protein
VTINASPVGTPNHVVVLGGSNNLFGADHIIGGSGNDTLGGGLGNDTITGGAGTDTFVFFHGDGADHITDMSSNDTINLIGFDHAVALAAINSATGHTVDFGNGDTLTLDNVLISSVLTLFHVA